VEGKVEEKKGEGRENGTGNGGGRFGGLCDLGRLLPGSRVSWTIDIILC